MKKSTNTRQFRLVLIIAGLALIAGTGATLQLLTRAAATCQKIVLAAYWYPDSGWTTAINTMPSGSYLILDIDGSGAGTQKDSTFVPYVQAAQAKGIKVIGYSDTSYGGRAQSLIKTDVQNYKSWYGVTDIFLDQVSSSGTQLSYYQTLYNYIHTTNPGSAVMLNPGTYPDEAYTQVGDILMVDEDTYSGYSVTTPPSWVNNYPAAKFAHVVHDTPAANLGSALSLSRSRNAGYVFVTDRGGANPYNGLPSYWTGELANINAACSTSPTPTPTSTPTPTPTPIQIGDLNGDGKVDIFDLSTLLSRWGTTDAAADFNHDGSVNIFDLSTLLSHWGA